MAKLIQLNMKQITFRYTQYNGQFLCFYIVCNTIPTTDKNKCSKNVPKTKNKKK